MESIEISATTPVILSYAPTKGDKGDTGPVGPIGPIGPIGPGSSVPGPQGIQGPQGINSYTTTATGFTVPAVGATVSGTLVEASWVVIGQILFIGGAGAGGTAGAFSVTAKAANTLTLQNVSGSPAVNVSAGATVSPGGPQGPQGPVGATGPGSGDMTKSTYDTNANGVVDTCDSLAWGKLTGLPTALLPPGTIIDYAGSAAPAGFLIADGSAVSRTTYSALFAALGGASSPWGAGDGTNTFNLPDLRGRVSIGTGTGTYPGASNRALAGSGGEELHALLTGELAAHNHAVFITDNGHNHSQNAHSHSIADQQHAHMGSNHQHIVGSHSHNVSDPAHAHYDSTYGVFGGSTVAIYQSGSGTSATTGSSGTGISVPSSNAFWTDAGTGGVATDYRWTGINGTAAATATDNASGCGLSATSGNTGSATGHQNMPPFIVTYKLIKT
jgi:microcystin-dependent protein